MGALDVGLGDFAAAHFAGCLKTAGARRCWLLAIPGENSVLEQQFLAALRAGLSRCAADQVLHIHSSFCVVLLGSC